MRAIIRPFLLVLALAAGAYPAAGQTRDGAVDSGKLLMFRAGKPAGAETFTIRTQEASDSSSTVEVSTPAVAFSTTTEYTGTQPKLFRLTKPPDTDLQFAIRGTEVQVTGSQQASGKTDTAAVILENLVWHQYYFLLKRYDAAKGGLQHFTAFVPSVMATVPATVDRIERAVKLEGIAAPLDHFQTTFHSTTRIEVWAEADGRLAYVSVPAQGWEAVNEKYAAGIDAIRRAIADAQKKLINPTVDYGAPPDAPFTAQEVTVPAKGYTLGATLLLPKRGSAPFPVVVTITGSGQQTRDEPVPIPGLEKYRPFRQIAEALAGQGIAVLRADDRGVGASGGREGLKTATSFDFADDTRAQIAWLRTRPDIDPDRIALVGHSEGGLIAPLVASTDPRIRAIVLMAGDGKTGEQIIMDQTAFGLDTSGGLDKARRDEAMAAQRNALKLAMDGTNLDAVPEAMRSPWYREFLKYDPVPTIRKVRQPILILQGALDQQITPEQASLLEQAARGAGNTDVTAKVLPGLNHLFLPSKTGSVGEYSSLTVTAVPQDVIDLITGWLGPRLR
jgi:uncharacterized protein